MSLNLHQHNELPQVNPAYQGYVDSKNWRADTFGNISAKEADYFSRELAPFYLSADASVLEIGFGNGGFLAYCRARNWRVEGIEIDPELIRRAEAMGFSATRMEAFGDFLAEKKQSYDLVVAWDVLEHIPLRDLQKLVKDVASLLKPGGYFMARFPNGHSPFGRLLQYGDLTHITVIGAYMAEQLGVMSGLKLVRIANPKIIFKSNPLRAALQMVFLLCRKFVEIFLGAIYFSRILPLDPNLIAVWRKDL